MLNLSAPDFSQHPPRSVRVRLGGFAHLPRLLDKARAAAAGTTPGNANIDPEALLIGEAWTNSINAFGQAPERIAGFVFIGTPGRPLDERPRPDEAKVVSVWAG